MLIPDDLIKAINKMGTFINNIQINYFDCVQYTAQQDHFGNTQDNNQDYNASIDSSEHESDGE